MDQSKYLLCENFVGKTIKEISADNYEVSITFTDGSRLNVEKDTIWDWLDTTGERVEFPVLRVYGAMAESEKLRSVL